MKPLKSQLFRGSARMQRAANFKGNSLKEGVQDDAVRRLLQALTNIEEQSGSLPPNLKPRGERVSAFQPPGEWGLFFRNQDEFNAGIFGGRTNLDVQLFHFEADLEGDGKAGINTIHRLDEIVAFLESLGPLLPFGRGIG